MKECCIFKRGQIWLLREDRGDTYLKTEDENNHITAKTRPWLIVSRDEANAVSPILSCAPISMSSDPNFLAHVSFKKVVKGEQRLQIIQLEQTAPKNISDFLDRGKYLYTLSEEKMQEVTEVLVAYMGGEIIWSNLSSSLAVVNNLLQKILMEKCKDADTQLYSIADMLAGLTSLEMLPSMSELTSSEILTGETKKNVRVKSTEAKVPKKSKRPSTRKVRHSWTEDEKQQFIKDCDNLTKEEVRKKWRLSTVNLVSTYYNRFKVSLKL